jgi:low affinity Fe/Cu permease
MKKSTAASIIFSSYAMVCWTRSRPLLPYSDIRHLVAKTSCTKSFEVDLRLSMGILERERYIY